VRVVQRWRIRAAATRPPATLDRAQVLGVRREIQSYLQLLDQIGAEAIRRANKAMDELKKKPPK